MSTDLPDWRAERAGQTVQDKQLTSSTAMVSNLSVITLDRDTEEDGQDSRPPILVHHATPTASISRDEHQWQQDACTLSEIDYVQKYYAKAIIAWLLMKRYRGLCTGQLLHIALLKAVARAQLRPTWKGMEFHIVFSPPQLLSLFTLCSNSSFPHQFFSFLFIPP
jgi:hypothetical protein